MAVRDRRSERRGESLVGFVICLPLLVAFLLWSTDLWGVALATTRCQQCASAGASYVERVADTRAGLQGTKDFSWYGRVSVPLAEIRSAALSNGAVGPEGGVRRVTVAATARQVGNTSYTVTNWIDGNKNTGTRTVKLFEVEVKCSETVPLSDGILRAVLGEEVIVTRTCRAQLPREVRIS